MEAILKDLILVLFFDSVVAYVIYEAYLDYLRKCNQRLLDEEMNNSHEAEEKQYPSLSSERKRIIGFLE